MTGCERWRAAAAGLAAMPPSHPERVAAWDHARSCGGCRRALLEGQRLQALLAEAAPDPLAADALAGFSQGLAAGLRREARRRAAASALAAGAAFLVLVLLSRQRSRAAADWAVAGSLGAASLALSALASRRARLVSTAAVAASFLAAALSGVAGPLGAVQGLECLAVELAAAGAVLGAGWLALRRGTTSVLPAAAAAAAAAGALAGDAALHLTCAARSALPHLLAFHAAGVVLAAAGAAALWPVLRRVPAGPP